MGPSFVIKEAFFLDETMTSDCRHLTCRVVANGHRPPPPNVTDVLHRILISTFVGDFGL